VVTLPLGMSVGGAVVAGGQLLRGHCGVTGPDTWVTLRWNRMASPASVVTAAPWRPCSRRGPRAATGYLPHHFPDCERGRRTVATHHR
jgi:hypothetical protein